MGWASFQDLGCEKTSMNPLLGILLAALLGGAGAASCYGGDVLYPRCDEGVCAGSCTLSNGCLCSNSSTMCIPNQATPCVLNSSACCPAELFWYPAEACCSVEPACSPDCLDDEICTALNGTTQCSCNMTMYRLLENHDLQPVVQCRGYWMNISISRCQLESSGYDRSTMTLRNDTSSCTKLSQGILDNKSVITAPVLLQTGWCGNEISVNASHVRYSNVLHLRPLSSGMVKVNHLYMSFSCSITRAVSTQLELVLNPKINSSSVLDGSTASPPSTLLPSSPFLSLSVAPLYVGLSVAFNDRRRFAFRTEQCFSNPVGDPSPLSSLQLIMDGHAADQGVHTQVIENGNSSQVKLQVGMFRFVNQNEVFIFCNSRLCDTAVENCSNPGLVRNLTLSEVSTTTFCIDWSAPEGGASSYVMKVFGFPALDTWLTADYATITGLTPGNYYTIQVFAEDGAHLGEASTISAFTIPGVVKNLGATNITTHSVFLTWLPPDGNRSSYSIQVLGEPSSSLEVQTESVLIEALKPGNFYTFLISVLVTDDPMRGESVGFFEYTVPDVVKNLSAINVTMNSAFLSWLPPIGNMSSYLIEVIGEPSSTMEVHFESVLIEGLKPGNWYTFMVSVLVTGNPNKVGSAGVSVQTVEGLLYLSVQTTSSLRASERQVYLLQQLKQRIEERFPGIPFNLKWLQENNKNN